MTSHSSSLLKGKEHPLPSASPSVAPLSSTSTSVGERDAVASPAELQQFLAAVERIVADCWGLTYQSVLEPYEGAAQAKDAPPAFSGGSKRKSFSSSVATGGEGSLTTTAGLLSPPLLSSTGQPSADPHSSIVGLESLYQENMALLLQIQQGNAALQRIHDGGTMDSTEDAAVLRDLHDVPQPILLSALAEAVLKMDRLQKEDEAFPQQSVSIKQQQQQKDAIKSPSHRSTAGGSCTVEDIVQLTCDYLFDPVLNPQTTVVRPTRSTQTHATTGGSGKQNKNIYECIAANAIAQDWLVSTTFPFAPPPLPYADPSMAVPEDTAKVGDDIHKRNNKARSGLAQQLDAVQDKGVGKVIRRSLEIHDALSTVAKAIAASAAAKVRDTADGAKSKLTALLAGPLLKSEAESPTMSLLHKLLRALQGRGAGGEEEGTAADSPWDQREGGAAMVRLLEAFLHYPEHLSENDFRPFQGDALEKEDVPLAAFPIGMPISGDFEREQKNADSSNSRQPCLVHSWMFIHQSGAVHVLYARPEFYRWRRQQSNPHTSAAPPPPPSSPLFTLLTVVRGNRRSAKLCGCHFQILLGTRTGVAPPLLGPPTSSLEHLMDQLPLPAEAFNDPSFASTQFSRFVTIVRIDPDPANRLASSSANTSSTLDTVRFLFLNDQDMMTALNLLWACSHPSRGLSFSLLRPLDPFLPERNGVGQPDEIKRRIWEEADGHEHDCTRQLLRLLQGGVNLNAQRQQLQQQGANNNNNSGRGAVAGPPLTRSHPGYGFQTAHRHVPGEWYPTVRSLGPAEVQFCEAWHLHPRIYLEAKLELLMRPERPYFSLMDVATLMVGPWLRSSDLVNFPVAEALVHFMVCQGLCEEHEWIERLPPRPV